MVENVGNMPARIRLPGKDQVTSLIICHAKSSPGKFQVKSQCLAAFTKNIKRDTNG